MNVERNPEERHFSKAQGLAIQKIRLQRAMTRAQVSLKSGVEAQRIFRIEVGRSTARAFDLALIAQVLGVPLAEIFPAAQAKEEERFEA